MGRKSKLTPEIATRIINALRAGSTQKFSYTSAGIKEATFYKWLEQGAAQTHGRFKEFRDNVEKAEADAAIRNITLIQKVAQGGDVYERSTVTRPDGSIVTTEKKTMPNWNAAAWWLERKFTDEFGRHDRLDHRAPDGPLVNQNFIIIEDRIGSARDITPTRLPPGESEPDER